MKDTEYTIEDVQDVIDELEEVVEERIRTEEKLKNEMSVLSELGISSIGEAEIELVSIEKKLKKKKKKLDTEFNEFKEDYASVFDLV